MSSSAVPETICEMQTVQCVRKECFTVCKQVPVTTTVCRPVTVTRQVLGWVWPERPDDYALGRFPVWAIDGLNAGGIYYGFPMTAEIAAPVPPRSARTRCPSRAPATFVPAARC